MNEDLLQQRETETLPTNLEVFKSVGFDLSSAEGRQLFVQFVAELEMKDYEPDFIALEGIIDEDYEIGRELVDLYRANEVTRTWGECVVSKLVKSAPAEDLDLVIEWLEEDVQTTLATGEGILIYHAEEVARDLEATDHDKLVDNLGEERVDRLFESVDKLFDVGL